MEKMQGGMHQFYLPAFLFYGREVVFSANSGAASLSQALAFC